MSASAQNTKTDQIVSFIKTVPLFHTLEADHVFRLTDELTIRDLAPNEVLTTRGEPCSELFIMLQGEAAAFVTEDSVNFERELKRFYPGSFFGMTHILLNDRAPSTIRVLEASKAIVLSKDSIERLFEESPTFAHAVCRSLASYLAESTSRIPALPFRQLDEFSDIRRTSRLIPSRISSQLQAIAVEQEDDRVVVAIVNPKDTRASEFIESVLEGYRVEFVAISAEDFSRHAETLFAKQSTTAASNEAPFEEFLFVGNDGSRTAVAENNQDIVSKALAYAIRVGASDVHFEPHAGAGLIRIRIDGKMLPFQADLSANALRNLISRLKVAAGLDITNVRRPQDGRFQVIADGRSIEFRVAIMPCEGGEKLVLRMSDSERHVLFDSLFVSKAVTRFAKDIFSQPSGLVLVTGPTGSGKTTSLYSVLQMLNRDNSSRNIVTVEDPVEYPLDFATQTHVDEHNGLGFDKMLRTILRQDPDIILVGEIRDRESAAIAVEAATTGHLVLSSLHTHSALETITRLRNLDVPEYLLADALKGVISQKLLPRIHGPNAVTVNANERIVQRLVERGIVGAENVSRLRRGREVEGGPPAGESGRIAMFEVLSITESLSDFIDGGATRAELAANMESESFFSFEQYSRLLLEQGHVAPEQVERALPKVAKLG